MKKVDKLASILILAGAINWGLIGLFGLDAIDYVFGQDWLDRLAYLLIGASALYKLVQWQAARQK